MYTETHAFARIELKDRSVILDQATASDHIRSDARVGEAAMRSSELAKPLSPPLTRDISDKKCPLADAKALCLTHMNPLLNAVHIYLVFSGLLA